MRSIPQSIWTFLYLSSCRMAKGVIMVCLGVGAKRRRLPLRARASKCIRGGLCSPLEDGGFTKVLLRFSGLKWQPVSTSYFLLVFSLWKMWRKWQQAFSVKAQESWSTARKGGWRRAVMKIFFPLTERGWEPPSKSARSTKHKPSTCFAAIQIMKSTVYTYNSHIPQVFVYK